MIDSKMIYRRNGKKIYIKQPSWAELEFVSKLWSDADTMKDIGGVYTFSKKKWEIFYNKMVYPGDGKNFYCLIYEATEEKPVGEVSFHGYDCVTKSARFNIKVLFSERRKGYGEEALKLLLEYYFLDFGGKLILDNVTTESGLKLVNKFGFEITGQYKDEIGIRLSKENFTNKNVGGERTVGILIYDELNMINYSMSKEMLKLANEYSKRSIFNINNILFKDNIKIDSELILNGHKQINKCDIIIIPSGSGIYETMKDNNVINFLNNNLRYCDFICAQGNGIKFLIKCKILEGIFIPKNAVDKEDKEYIPEIRLIDKQFIDNGKVMISSNIIGQIELMLRLIDKVAGKEIAKKVGIKIGVTYE